MINKLNDLIAKFKQGQYSVREFQARLEPCIYEMVDSTFVKKFENRLELIIYTIPETEQRGHAEILADEISAVISKQGI